MTASAHERYRDRLEVLADDTVMGAVLDRFGRGPWARRFGRFEPDRSPWATLVHRGAGPLAAVLTTELYDGCSAPQGCTETAAGPARVRSYIDDERLTGLASVLASATAHEVVRYRPRKRCTLWLDTVDSGRFVKVLPAGREREGERIIADARRLWRASQRGDLEFTVAQPDRFDRATASVWHHVVPGTPIDQLILGADGAGVAERLGSALGGLAAAAVRARTTTRRSDQLDRTARAAARAAAAAPDLSSALEAQLRALSARADDLPPERALPIHGAPHVHQWLQHGERLGLVDFDRFAMGEPELDLATFLAELQDESGLSVDLADIATAMVTGFERSGPRLEASVLEWYRANKRIAKVARTATSLRPDGDRRAARHLAALRGVPEGSGG